MRQQTGMYRFQDFDTAALIGSGQSRGALAMLGFSRNNQDWLGQTAGAGNAIAMTRDTKNI